MSFIFKKQYFELLNKYNNQARDKNDLEQNQAYEALKEANALTKKWGVAVLKRLFPYGYLGTFINRPTNQANNFKPYTWAKIYPRKNSPKQLAYTVGIDAASGFVVKIDTVGDVGDKRVKYEELRGEYEASSIVSILSIQEGLNKTLEELVEWSIDELQKFGFTYEDVCAELELEDVVDTTELTVRQALNYLKNRYKNSEQKTQKIFLSTNELDKEIALETRDFFTSTIRIFIKDLPPKLIIPNEQCKFIKNGESPNDNLNSNTRSLRVQDELYQVSPKTQEELHRLCDWLDEITDNSAVVDLKNKDTGSNKLNRALNRILFGAAGTGKTYNTINHALSILDNQSLEDIKKENRTKLKADFDHYVEQGRIKFVTFHQSFSYEDFVEGIRAETDEQGALSYDVKSGVFKEICERANFQKFSEIDIDKVVDDFAEEISKNEKLLETKTGIEFTVFNSSGKGGISVRTTTQNEIVISKKAIKAYLLEPSENIRRNQAYAWAVARYLQSKLDEMTPVSKRNPQDYVLIIDEINRGNISRIFGELITLIEDSKRQDADEALSVTLPYSKEEFSVPDNVYIIGTMNSSDRSLTGLDIALRRRFTFIEMPPMPLEIKNNEGELLKVSGKDKNGKDVEVTVADLLTVMNQRIEVLLDRDHCIGHASFMSLKDKPTLENLAEIFKQKIIPQLQEYFFDDWSKINLVLFQNGMVTEDNEINISSLFPADAQLETDYSERKKVWRINNDAFKTIDAFKKILGLKE